MLHERHPAVIRRIRRAEHGCRPENGVALTAGGAMRAEDDRRVRQEQLSSFSKLLSPFWGTNLNFGGRIIDSGPLE